MGITAAALLFASILSLCLCDPPCRGTDTLGNTDVSAARSTPINDAMNSIRFDRYDRLKIDSTSLLCMNARSYGLASGPLSIEFGGALSIGSGAKFTSYGEAFIADNSILKINTNSQLNIQQGGSVSLEQGSVVSLGVGSNSFMTDLEMVNGQIQIGDRCVYSAFGPVILCNGATLTMAESSTLAVAYGASLSIQPDNGPAEIKVGFMAELSIPSGVSCVVTASVSVPSRTTVVWNEQNAPEGVQCQLGAPKADMLHCRE